MKKEVHLLGEPSSRWIDVPDPPLRPLSEIRCMETRSSQSESSYTIEFLFVLDRHSVRVSIELKNGANEYEMVVRYGRSQTITPYKATISTLAVLIYRSVTDAVYSCAEDCAQRALTHWGYGL